MDALRLAYPFRLGAHVREQGAFVDIEIVDGQIGERWTLACNGTGWAFDDAPATVWLASLSLSGEQAWRLLTNNYDPATHGTFRAAGEPDIVATLTKTRAIVGTPK